uniref:Uncharacterized protein LOC114330572 isoform X1 n=1 Tax=Diabrotica virgifera virgifera TaxID=50390 RepID=A0A6P7FLB8_DIAVI
MKNLILATIVFYVVYQAVHGMLLCRCDKVKCDNENLVCSDSEVLVKNGSYCRCCDDCYKKIYEGDTCTPPFRGVPFKARCVDGLKCDLRQKNAPKSLLNNYELEFLRG